MPEARELALRALSHRDRSRRELERRLERAGVPADERTATLDALADTGLLSDERFAEARARGLAAKNAGDALIRNDLRRHGIEPDAIAELLEALEPESERAARIFRRRGGGDRALRYLAGKGFRRESLEPLVDDPVC
ncbi:MAG TPA: RecX family transcriptional regulator [Gaiellaceae bacterium]|nr:RecX family transcriptional regulator [Gaiellaceae bacterium]